MMIAMMTFVDSISPLLSRRSDPTLLQTSCPVDGNGFTENDAHQVLRASDVIPQRDRLLLFDPTRAALC